MKATALLCLVLLFAGQLLANNSSTIQNEISEIGWEANAPGEFRAKVSISTNQLDIDQVLEINVELTYPKTHQPQWKALIAALLTFDGFGISPFSLVNQKLEPTTPKSVSENILSQKLSIVLSPKIPGKHYLTFYDIPFIPISGKEGGAITKIVSNIMPIDVTMPASHFKPDLIIALPMDLSKELPITISSANKRAFIKNDQVKHTVVANDILSINAKSVPWQFFAGLLTCLIMLMVMKIKAFEKTDRS